MITKKITEGKELKEIFVQYKTVISKAENVVCVDILGDYVYLYSYVKFGNSVGSPMLTCRELTKKFESAYDKVQYSRY